MTTNFNPESGGPTKQCSTCGIVKSYFQYTKRKASPDGFTASCKNCVLNARKQSERLQNYMKAYRAREENKKRRYERDNTPEAKSLALERRRTPETRAKLLAYKRSREGFTARLKSQYGITFETWSAFLNNQSGLCPGCLEPLSERACVEHCHKTGDVRGIMCTRCNTAIGLALDNVETLRRLANYLEQHAKSTS